MFGKILVPLDAGQVSEEALPVVAALAGALGDPVAVVSVIPDPGDLNPLVSKYDAVLHDLDVGRRAYASTYLEGVRGRLEAKGVHVAAAVRAGDPATEILAAAAADGAGLIAMATHGRSGPERWFVGSVADRVVHSAPMPVLLVRPGERPHPEQVSDIIVPLDGSPVAERALPVAMQLAQALSARVTLVRTVASGWLNAGTDMYGGTTMSPDVITVIEDDARAYLEATAARLRGGTVEVQTSFALFHAPDLQIDEIAVDCPAPLVVMTSHGRSGVERALLGSVADRVVRSSTAPVLVIRDA